MAAVKANLVGRCSGIYFFNKPHWNENEPLMKASVEKLSRWCKLVVNCWHQLLAGMDYYQQFIKGTTIDCGRVGIIMRRDLNEIDRDQHVDQHDRIAKMRRMQRFAEDFEHQSVRQMKDPIGIVLKLGVGRTTAAIDA